MFFPKTTYLARHVETSKNILKLHGTSQECAPTPNSQSQIEYLINFCQNNLIKKVYSAKTAQCKFTSHLICKKLNINYIELDVPPINLGKMSGLDHNELMKNNIELARGMEQFRFRISSFNNSNLAKFFCQEMLTNEIKKWESTINPSKFANSLLILSNSLLVKLYNLNINLFPNQNQYMNIGVANAGIVRLYDENSMREQWPNVISKQLSTKYGTINFSEYISTISPYSDLIVIIYPGVFGASRFGPYNLFNRMARELAEFGIRCILFDPLGSGESTPVIRSIETEMISINAIINHFSVNKLCLCAHSLSGNITNKLRNNKLKKILIAPVLPPNDIQPQISFINEKLCNIHGMIFDKDLLENNALYNFPENEDIDYYYGTKDKYVSLNKIKDFSKNNKVHIIKDADHNFSIKNSSNHLINKIIRDISKYYWKSV